MQIRPKSADLSLYYDNITYVPNLNFGNTQTFSHSTTGGDYSQIPTTFNVVLGTTLNFGLDAVATNNVIPTRPTTAGQVTAVRSFLGISCSASRFLLIPPTASLCRISVGHAHGNIWINPRLRQHRFTQQFTGVVPPSPQTTIQAICANLERQSSKADVPPRAAYSAVWGSLGNLAGQWTEFSNTARGANILGQYAAAAANLCQPNATDF